MEHKEPQVVALITAGGNGSRMGQDLPKQFTEVCGAPIFIHTLRAFDKIELVDATFLVCQREWLSFVEESLKNYNIQKIIGVALAGQTAIQSIRNGVSFISEWAKTVELGIENGRSKMENLIVITHESVRPMFTERMIEDNIQVANQRGNAIAAVESYEAYLTVDDDNSSKTIVPRDSLRRAQTPQTFRLSLLNSVFKKADELNIVYSQSLFTLVKDVFPDFRFYFSEGSLTNLKITYPNDLLIFQTYFPTLQKSAKTNK